ncbi:MAG: HRDC domain-containing protein [Opitutales bacterium]|nr:HRDC domain-containing protein [Opitutales bacterium]
MSKVSFHYRFFQIPAHGDHALEEELNGFLKSHTVVDVSQEFVPSGSSGNWCFSVRWRDGALAKQAVGKARAMVDYREILEPADFACFVRLRELRKELAKKEEVPAYAIFTNEQLAELARARPTSPSGLTKIDGIGESRVKKYGTIFLKVLGEELLPSPAKKSSD